MKFVLACYGTRGDVEPCAAVGRELLRRGHDVRMAVPPDLVGFAESAGLAAVAYGPDTQAMLDAHRNFWTRFFRNFWRIRDLIRLWRESWEPVTPVLGGDEHDADVAGGRGRPAIHRHDFRGAPLPTSRSITTFRWPRCITSRCGPTASSCPFLPAPLSRSAMTVVEWLVWRMMKKAEDAQRRELGLPKATGPAPRRIAERGSLEIQAYDEVCFPGLAAEWAKWDGQTALCWHADDGVADGCR